MLQTSEEPKGGEGGQVVVIVVIRRIRIQIWEVVTAVRVVAARFVAHVSAYVWKTSGREGREAGCRQDRGLFWQGPGEKW